MKDEGNFGFRISDCGFCVTDGDENPFKLMSEATPELGSGSNKIRNPKSEIHFILRTSSFRSVPSRRARDSTYASLPKSVRRPKGF